MPVAKVAILLTAVAGALFVLGPALAFFRLVPPLVGFALFAAHALFAIVAALLAAFALFRRGAPDLRGGTVAALMICLVLLVALALLVARNAGVPAIHDVSTDLDDAPRFHSLAEHPANRGRDLTYPHGDAQTARLVEEHYPDLEPVALAVPAARAFELAARAAEEAGWEVVERAPHEGRIEATHTSGIFRFVDDVVIRVRETDGGCRVDLRSTSRVGRSDLGANAARIRDFTRRLRELVEA